MYRPPGAAAPSATAGKTQEPGTRSASVKYNVQNTGVSVQCTVSSVHCAVCSVQCALSSSIASLGISMHSDTRITGLGNSVLFYNVLFICGPL